MSEFSAKLSRVPTVERWSWRSPFTGACPFLDRRPPPRSPGPSAAMRAASTTRAGGAHRCLLLRGTGLLFLTFPGIRGMALAPALGMGAPLPAVLGVGALPPASAAVRRSPRFVLGAGGERPLPGWARGPSRALASRSSGKTAPPAAVAARNCCSTSLPWLSFPYSPVNPEHSS
jgi:hypothetical protein